MFYDMTTATMPWSEFLRASGAGLATVAERDLVLQRRDGPDLLVTEARREDAARQTLGALAETLAQALRQKDLSEIVIAAMRDAMPWIRALPEGDQGLFMEQLVEKASQASSLGDYGMLDVLLSQWSNTALVHANPALLAKLAADPDSGEPVPRP